MIATLLLCGSLRVFWSEKGFTSFISHLVLLESCKLIKSYVDIFQENTWSPIRLDIELAKSTTRVDGAWNKSSAVHFTMLNPVGCPARFQKRVVHLCITLDGSHYDKQPQQIRYAGFIFCGSHRQIRSQIETVVKLIGFHAGQAIELMAQSINSISELSLHLNT